MAWVADTAFSTVLSEFYSSGFDYISDNGDSARAKRWVNQSYFELCSLEDWPFLNASASGAAPLAVSDLGPITNVRDTVTDITLVESDEELLSRVDPDYSNTAGSASYYYINFVSGAPEILVYPVSTNNIEVVYTKVPTELSADADVLIVPNQFIDVVVLGAMRRGLIDGTDTQGQLQIVQQELQSRVDSMRRMLPRVENQEITWASEDW